MKSRQVIRYMNIIDACSSTIPVKPTDPKALIAFIQHLAYPKELLIDAQPIFFSNFFKNRFTPPSTLPALSSSFPGFWPGAELLVLLCLCPCPCAFASSSVGLYT